MTTTPNPYVVPSTGTQAASIGAPNTPRPPAVGLPVEHVSGSYAERLDPDADNRQQGYDSTPGPQLTITPTPIVGAIPYGGVVLQSGTWAPAVNDLLELGDTGNGKPLILGVMLTIAAGVSAFDVITDRDQLTRGWGLPSGNALPIWLPVRHLILRCTTGAIPLSYAVLAYPVTP